MRSNDYDVLIAGGGPVGLMLACELRMYGVSTLVVERLAPGAGEPRTLTIHARTLEIMDRRDLLSDFVAAEERTAGLDDYRRRLENTSARGHFAGMFLLGRGTVATEQPRELLLPRATIETLLARRATGTGAVVRHGAEVVGLEQNADGVAVTLEDAQGSTVIRAGFVVGCDGGRSTVRRHAGIDFPGTEPQMVSRMGLGSLTGPDRLPMGWHRNEHGWFMRMPDGRISTAEWDHVPPQAPVTDEELAESVRRVTGERIQFADVRFVSRFTDSTRLAAQYRAGRVLLAGDAAHVHYPAGGQGANLGLQDAVNLGWKLAAACQGRPGLLDTYEAERRPIAERVLLNTRAQAALMRPGPQVDALRALFAELMDFEAVNDYLTKAIYGTDVHYGGSDDPRVGHFVADRPLKTHSGPTRLAELLRDGRPLLLDLTDASMAVRTAQPWTDRVRTVAALDTDAEAAALLIRPDGYLAWAGEAPVHDEDLRTALTDWFGPARA
ncbi:MULTISPECIES: FAD-dependent monooxygenase [unclassified Streptomyces]|uniref:FAD-dependent monooxygenase n=1 Tax=unclassified Streptomyces TaxID=2593676 RepID=UPI00055BC5BF|nr:MULTISPECIES: FAD-dependent monooxygenase [unclassified Streptomyces]MYT30089.1 polyketide oxidase [Streptomyces sp. SID8354]